MFVIFHNHYYQPPREEPWTGEILPEPHAYPYLNWNERIYEECYSAHACVPVYGHDGKIRRFMNLYEHVSFNFGPTLLQWLERHHPALYTWIIESDKLGQKRYGGTGNALAQSYYHVILPLAHPEDRELQVLWGIEDFRTRFGRLPDGMWLPEMAVDSNTLAILAHHGVRFTILSSHQVKAWRTGPGEPWIPVAKHQFIPFQPCRCPLPDGNEITIFFIHEKISHALAFTDITKNGERLLDILRSEKNRTPANLPLPPVLTIAVDGETYGHHHPFGELALAWVLEQLESHPDLHCTTPSAYLDRYTPLWEVQLYENTSWSCPHGVERWRDHCGCRIERIPGANQHWRKPLRKIYTSIRNTCMTVIHEKLKEYGIDAHNFFLTPPRVHTSRKIPSSSDDLHRTNLMRLLNSVQAMFTSCGWFFDDPSDPETIITLRHAFYALHLASLYDPSISITDCLKQFSAIQTAHPHFSNVADIIREHILPFHLKEEDEALLQGTSVCLFHKPAPFPHISTLACQEKERIESNGKIFSVIQWRGINTFTGENVCFTLYFFQTPFVLKARVFPHMSFSYKRKTISRALRMGKNPLLLFRGGKIIDVWTKLRQTPYLTVLTLADGVGHTASIWRWLQHMVQESLSWKDLFQTVPYINQCLSDKKSVSDFMFYSLLHQTTMPDSPSEFSSFFGKHIEPRTPPWVVYGNILTHRFENLSCDVLLSKPALEEILQWLSSGKYCDMHSGWWKVKYLLQTCIEKRESPNEQSINIPLPYHLVQKVFQMFKMDSQENPAWEKLHERIENISD